MISLDQKYRLLLEHLTETGPAGRQRMRLCFEALALAAAIDRDGAARLGRHGLSEGRFVLLVVLLDAPDGLSPHALAEAAGVTRATVTGLLDGLEGGGWIRRDAHADDRRRLTVRLTPDGAARARRLRAEHGRWLATLVDGLSDDERQTLSRLLGRVFAGTAAGRGRPG
ncbi:MarR family winged helix-turn-helix transcriptional regulator [Methylobacterium oryzihabitans]|uniref:MarR family transcriptional regulator n=1 Tax=Methylobacterium oryzihabitans TaxID=2499852 RepID=A0A437NVH3_9HYPH|nr:MarR family transcriptional regulator [Methylobacterium oryzihabitans]RVU14013.1 MarR family transcriptional regulator [Methylobacterium oryzihabitans]